MTRASLVNDVGWWAVHRRHGSVIFTATTSRYIIIYIDMLNVYIYGYRTIIDFTKRSKQHWYLLPISVVVTEGDWKHEDWFAASRGEWFWGRWEWICSIAKFWFTWQMFLVIHDEEAASQHLDRWGSPLEVPNWSSVW